MKRMKVLVCANLALRARLLAHPRVITRRICNHFYWIFSGLVGFIFVFWRCYLLHADTVEPVADKGVSGGGPVA